VYTSKTVAGTYTRLPRRGADSILANPYQESAVKNASRLYILAA
jgi:hypothetical protein